MVEWTSNAANLSKDAWSHQLRLKCPHMTHITAHTLTGGAWQSGWLSHWCPRWLKLFQLSSMVNLKFSFLQCPLCAKISNKTVPFTCAPQMRSPGLPFHIYRGIVYYALVFIICALWIHSMSGLSRGTGLRLLFALWLAEALLSNSQWATSFPSSHSTFRVTIACSELINWKPISQNSSPGMFALVPIVFLKMFEQDSNAENSGNFTFILLLWVYSFWGRKAKHPLEMAKQGWHVLALLGSDKSCKHHWFTTLSDSTLLLEAKRPGYFLAMCSH